ncbi:MAG: exosortase/archaeosortase family protein [Syntrophaceae bacterium]
MDKKTEITRHVHFLIALCVAAAMIYGPLTELFHSSMNRDYHSLIPFIPCISGYLIYLKRKDIFTEKTLSFRTGTVVIFIGIILYVTGRTCGVHLNQNDYATIITFSALVLILGAFILAYGLHSFWNALFPLLFLIFMVPIPAAIMDNIIIFLQEGSTEFTNLLLLASGVPFLREGFVFHLPSQSVEVAPQCSGIRSGLALFITALLAGHLFLRTWWKKIILVLCIFPITMLKNGIRITTLTLLGAYVDPRILQSSLHREGGIPFFIVALMLMAPILFFLKKSEQTKVQGAKIKLKGEKLDSGSGPE